VLRDAYCEKLFEKTKPISVKMGANCFVGERYESKSRRGLRENKANRRPLAGNPKCARSHPQAVLEAATQPDEP
jgi:hypothetical protein